MTKKTRLTAHEALEISKRAQKKQIIANKKKKIVKVFELTDEQKTFQLDWLHEQIIKAAEEGKTEAHALYNAIDEDTGKPVFSLPYFQAVAREFKKEYPYYMVIHDDGPLRRITIKWSGNYES